MSEHERRHTPAADRHMQGQGKGHTFAHAAASGIGAFDWPDCQSMVHEVVARGLADPDRLGVAGWSHGK